jgi:hypothetical protein
MERKLLLGFILSVLFLFLFQQLTKHVRGLDGDFKITKKQSFSVDSLYASSYQKNITKWANENFGFRPTLVRFHNQLGFWAYKRSYTNTVIVGKDNYLFDKKNIDAFTGADFMGEDFIKNKVWLLHLLQDSLAAHNIQLLFVIAAGKVSFFNEYVPNNYLRNKKTGNYEVLTTLLKANGINHIDFRKQFDSLKSISKYPLYPKCGIHWSNYGAAFAADSIIKKIGYLTKTQIPRMHFDSIVVSSKLSAVDEDVNTGMNLLWNIENMPMAYPTLSFSEGQKKIKLLSIADSYYWPMPLAGLSNHVFKQMDFIYYNRMLYASGKNEPIEGEHINQIGLTIASDVVMLLITDENFAEFGWNYLEQVYKGMFDLKSEAGIKIPSSIAIIINDIKHKPDLLDSYKKTANDLNISLDSLVYLNALKLYKQKGNNGI